MPCKLPLDRAFRFAGLQEDLAIGFHLLAGFANLLHNGLGVLTLLELHVHLEGHKIHRSAVIRKIQREKVWTVQSGRRPLNVWSNS